MIDKTRLYSISELATEFAITARAIRFYEDKGLLSPRRVGSNRAYDYRDRARLSLVLRFKGLGFPLDKTKEFLDLYDADETHLVQLKVGYRGICGRINELQQQIATLQQDLSELMELKDEAISKLRERGVDPDNEL
ncbi:MAG: MerR family transcriptional regulator [Proteobacteria bacterium]|nr:MAG: MerR family transcriptional regulator [Pseudomonadota bacterium]QKK12029.1 MAG: MerR family transcriptional regulator [Pseudomonadota bacterium]